MKLIDEERTFKKNDDGSIDIEWACKKHIEASLKAAPGEHLSTEELSGYRSDCKKVSDFIKNFGMTAPIGYTCFQDARQLIDGNRDANLSSSFSDSGFPHLPLYVFSPTEIMASTIAKLIDNIDLDGPIYKDDLRVILQSILEGWAPPAS